MNILSTNQFLSLFATHWASTLLMVGLIWFVQVVHYPLMEKVGADKFQEYSLAHQSRTTWVVVVPMIVELATAVLLLVLFPALRTSPLFVVSCILLLAIWISTAVRLVPLHQALAAGYDRDLVTALVRANWLRTVCWSLRGILLGLVGWSAIQGSLADKLLHTS